MSGSPIWASLECHCWRVCVLPYYVTTHPPAIQKQHIDTQEKLKMNRLNSLSVNVRAFRIQAYKFIPNPTARERHSRRKPEASVLIPHGYLHPCSIEHSEVQRIELNITWRLGEVKAVLGISKPEPVILCGSLLRLCETPDQRNSGSDWLFFKC
jgi:hypothetical protein